MVRHGEVVIECNSRVAGAPFHTKLSPSSVTVAMSRDHVLAATTAAAEVIYARLRVPKDQAPTREEVDACRAKQHEYCALTKQLLQEAVEADVALEAVEQVQQIGSLESQQRFVIAETELLAGEQAFRGLLTEAECHGFQCIQDVRWKESLVPWCQFSCKYCCMRRLDWESHVAEQYDVISFGTMCPLEEEGRSFLVAAEEYVRRALCDSFFVLDAFLKAQTHERMAFEAEFLASSCTLEKVESADRSSIRREVVDYTTSLRVKGEAVLLQEKHLAVLRIQDSLGLQERRTNRQMLQLVVEEEDVERKRLAGTEDVRRGEFGVRFSAALNAATANEWKTEMKELLNEREELRSFRENTLKKIEDDKVAAERSVQAELEAELREIKKMKKAGPPKNPPLPTCPKCGQTPAKDMFTHRTAECPSRPVQCLKCERILLASQQDAHKSTCPSRIVQCPSCQNYYKASFLEGTHSAACQRIVQARAQLQAERPIFPADFGLQDGAGCATVAVAPSSADSTGLKERWVLVTCNGVAVASADQVEQLVSTCQIGAALQLQLQPCVPPPTGEGAATPPPMRSLSTNVAALNLSPDKVLELRQLITSDEGQYCKPQPSSAATKKRA